MELEFNHTRIPYLKRISREVKYQEETCDAIVPDSYPDIGVIVDSYADPVIRGKDCREGSVIVSGGIKGGIIYVPEGQSEPKDLEFYIPFTVKLENQALSEQAKIISSVRIRSVDGKMINSRKAMLRVNLGCEIEAYLPDEMVLYHLQSQPQTLRTQEKSYQIQLPLEVSEKSFVVGDTLELPVTSPPIDKIFKVLCRLEMTETKLIGNKGVFKGLVICKITYLSEDQRIHVYEQQLPFSQYCEFNMDYDEDHVQILPVITGYDLEDQSQQRQFRLTVNILAQALVSASREIEVINDAYSLDAELLPQWQHYRINSLLDAQRERKNLQHTVECAIREVSDADVYLDYPTSDYSEDQVRVKCAVDIHALGLDQNDDYCGKSEKTDISQMFSLASGGKCVSKASMTGGCYTAALMNGVEIRFDMILENSFYSEQSIQGLCDANIEPMEGAAVTPSAILKKVSQDTSLWELGKKYHACAELIRRANQLTGDYLEDEAVLLIPMG